MFSPPTSVAPQMFIGLSLPKVHAPWWVTWVLVAFLLFHIIIELLLEIHGCINSRKQKRMSYYTCPVILANVH